MRQSAQRALWGLLLLVPALGIGQTMRWSYEYDAVGNLTKITDPRGIVTTFGYDALSRRTLTTQPPAASGGTSPTIGAAYDGINQPKTVTDPRSLVTSYTTDGLGKTTTLASPDTGSTIKTYNDAGLVATSKDARNVTATYSYDALNRVTQIVYSGTGFTTLTDSFSYDQGTNGIGKLTGMTYAGGSTSWSYDGFGRLASKTQTLGTVVLGVQKSYDAAGRVASITYPSGKVVAYSYTNGQATAVTVNGSNIATSIAYLPFGAVSSWTWGNGTTHTRSFDTYGRMTGHPVGADLRTLSYDDAGRITAITHFPATGLDQSFGYDNLDRLNQVTAASTTRGYGYDLTGNRTQATVNAATDTYTTGSTSNRLTGISGSISRTMSYDAMGNITADGNLTATYDARGRMSTVQIGAAANTTYVYDALGQRVKKSGGPAGTVHYVYDEDGKVLGEYDGSGTAVREYVWLGEMPLAVLAPSETLYVHADHLNAPRALMNSSNQLRWRWISDPFGVVAPEEDPSSLGAFVLNLRLPGQLYDIESNLHYNYFRDYAPAYGRYVESDPIGLKGGSNTYAYVEDQPTKFADLLGLDRWGDDPYFQRLCPCPAIPRRPSGVSCDVNIDQARDQYNPFWFYGQVRNKGPWDYKQQGGQFQDFGNFNYGAVGAAFGFTDQILLRGAGAAQMLAGTSTPQWGYPWGSSPYGDDPADQQQIQDGIRYFRCRCYR